MSGQEQTISRRDFVKGGGVLIGGLAASPAAGSAALGATADEPGRARVPDTVLGRTGVRVSRLGIGCAYFQRKQVTSDDVRATLHRALELGVNYLDTAPTYGNPETGFAEDKMGPAI